MKAASAIADSTTLAKEAADDRLLALFDELDAQRRTGDRRTCRARQDHRRTLPQWPPEDAARLGELQFLLTDEVGRLLDTLPFLLRRLTTSSSREEEWDFERLRGPVPWSRTLALRAVGGSPQLWVTSPARRNYQTAENRMLVDVLDAIGDPDRVRYPVVRLGAWLSDELARRLGYTE